MIRLFAILYKLTGGVNKRGIRLNVSSFECSGVTKNTSLALNKIWIVFMHLNWNENPWNAIITIKLFLRN